MYNLYTCICMLHLQNSNESLDWTSQSYCFAQFGCSLYFVCDNVVELNWFLSKTGNCEGQGETRKLPRTRRAECWVIIFASMPFWPPLPRLQKKFTIIFNSMAKSANLSFLGIEICQSDHWLCLSLTPWRLVDLMAVNDANCLMMSQQLLQVFQPHCVH